MEGVTTMNKFYSMLMQFSQGTTPSRTHLKRKFGEALIDEALYLGYIIELRKNEFDDPIYAITASGIEKRDN